MYVDPDKIAHDLAWTKRLYPDVAAKYEYWEIDVNYKVFRLANLRKPGSVLVKIDERDYYP